MCRHMAVPSAVQEDTDERHLASGGFVPSTVHESILRLRVSNLVASTSGYYYRAKRQSYLQEKYTSTQTCAHVLIPLERGNRVTASLLGVGLLRPKHA